MIQRWSTTVRMAFALAMMSSAVLLMLGLFGFYGNEQEQRLLARARLCESLAVSCSHAVSQDDEAGVQFLLGSLVKRNDEVLSSAVRKPNGNIRFSTKGHSVLWQLANDDGATSNCIYVSVMNGSEKWGQVEVCFERLVTPGFLGFFQLTSVRVPVIATFLNLLAFAYTLRRFTRRVDTSKIVPGRVRSALDSLAEGLLLLDGKQQIVHANQALCDTIGNDVDTIRGLKIGKLPWVESSQTFSWRTAIGSEGFEFPVMKLTSGEGEPKSFNVNKSPIVDDDGVVRGTLVSLDDITEIDQKNTELNSTLDRLEESRKEITDQNLKLQLLATQDPLTGCLNRRAYFSHFEDVWKQNRRYGIPVACVMIDIDFFKQINDNYGHAIGDEVLKQVGSKLLELIRETDFVCRYGGEEFCVLLPHIDMEGGLLAAERYRKALNQLRFSVEELTISASLGVSDTSCSAKTPEEMIDQADQCLYVAKRGGRDQAIRFDQISEYKSRNDNLASEQENNHEQNLKRLTKDIEMADSALDKAILLNDLCATLIEISRSENKCCDVILNQAQQVLQSCKVANDESLATEASFS